MPMNSNAVLKLVSPILFTLVVAVSQSVANNAPIHRSPGTAVAAYAATDARTVMASGRRSTIRLADTHSDACLWNYNNCLKGCDGAASCSSQCKVNYDGCLRQGG